MGFYVKDATTRRQIKGFKVRQTAGTVRTIGAGKIRDADGNLKLFFAPIALTVTPQEVSAFGGAFSGSVTLTTPAVTAVVVGGVPPFTYLWARETGDADVVPLTPAAASCAFRCTVPVEDSRYTIFEIIVTDANGAKTNGVCSVTMTCVDYS